MRHLMCIAVFCGGAFAQSAASGQFLLRIEPKGLWGIIIVNAPDRESARALLLQVEAAGRGVAVSEGGGVKGWAACGRLLEFGDFATGALTRRR